MGYRVPAFSYPGGKVRLREWLVKRMPMSGGKYVEPFAGRGNVFWLAVHMLDFREWWLNDPWTARWFEAIQRVDLRKIPDSLTEQSVVRMYAERARTNREFDDEAVAIEDSTLYAGGSPRGICYRWQRSPSLLGLKKRLSTARSILKAIQSQITPLPWESMGLEGLSSGDFVYLDPPYETAEKRLYECETVDHPQLLGYLLTAPHLWMLSGYQSILYHRFLGNPIAAKEQKVFFSQQYKSGLRVMRTECIWTNYTMGVDGIPRRKRLKRRRIRKKSLQK